MMLMKKILESMGYTVGSMTSGEISESTIIAADILGINVEELFDNDTENVKNESVIFLDTHDAEDNKNWIIDHHPDAKNPQGDSIIISRCSSNAFLIYKNFRDFYKFDNDDMYAIAVATVMDTMYLTSKKMVSEEIEELENMGLNMKEINSFVKSRAIPTPDFDDIFQNQKSYKIGKEHLRTLDDFRYISGYLELDIPGISVRDIPLEIIKEQLPQENSMFCIYDYQKEETFMVFKILGVPECYYFEFFDHIAARGTELRPWVTENILIPYFKAREEEVFEYVSDFFEEHSDLKTNTMGTVMFAHTAAKFGIKSQIVKGTYLGKEASLCKIMDKYMGILPDTRELLFTDEVEGFIFY